MGIPVDKVTFREGALNIDFQSIGARYEGKLNKDGTELAGTWTQGPGPLPLTFRREGAPVSPGSGAATKSGAGGRRQKEGSPGEKEASRAGPSDPIKEIWIGFLETSGVKLRIVVHLVRGADGVLTATVDSPDQGAKGIPVARAVYKDRRLILELPAVAARYEGTMDEAGTRLTGQWTQRGVSLPSCADPDRCRPEGQPTAGAHAPASLPRGGSRVREPRPRREAGRDAHDAQVGGPLPRGPPDHGLGAEDRDETVFGHKPFFVLSDHLTRQGIAVLRVDDRGVGGSSAGPAGATTDDLVEDVLAGVAFLKSRPGIDAARIGLIGHSEGGLIAPLASVRSRGIAFLVLLGAPGLPGEQIVLAQSALLLKADGAGAEQIAAARAINTRVFGIVKEEKDPAAAEKRIRQELASVPGMAPGEVDAQVRAVLSPWFRFFLTYDPRPTLARVTAPVLALWGERDLQVPARENLDAVRDALDKAGHKNHTLRVLPGLNHLFQACTTGAVGEYAAIEQTFSPGALDTISGWILAQGRPRPA